MDSCTTLTVLGVSANVSLPYTIGTEFAILQMITLHQSNDTTSVLVCFYSSATFVMCAQFSVG